MINVELLRTWCQGDRHPAYVTVPRDGDRANTDETDISMSEPQPCVVVDGAALCVVCWTVLGQELSAYVVADIKDRWQRIDTYAAIESATSLVEKQ